MVGPEAERSALVRHCCRLYVIGANLTVPIFSVVLRKAYGLGAQGMVGGSFHLPAFSVAWPTGEFGPMNLEGAVKLGFRKELEAISDPAQRKAQFARPRLHSPRAQHRRREGKGQRAKVKGGVPGSYVMGLRS